jgi:hypothetical protein
MSDADALVRAACSFDPRVAVALLASRAMTSRHDMATGCVAGDAEQVAELLATSPGAAREPVGPFGWEPILYATFSRLPRADLGRAEGLRAVARLLLDAGADPNASFDHDGWLQVPLYGAAGILNDAELTGMLIAAGADPNDNGTREVGEALYHGCEFPDPACAAMLIDAGTDRTVVRYCLGRALNFPYAEVAEMFCAHGARATAGHLLQAVWRRRPARTVQALLDAGARVDGDPDTDGVPLGQAAWRRYPDIVRLLGLRGAPLVFPGGGSAIGAALHGSRNCQHPEGGPTMQTVGEIPPAPYAEIVRFLLDAGAPVPERLSEGAPAPAELVDALLTESDA